MSKDAAKINSAVRRRPGQEERSWRRSLRTLVGSGHKIGLFILPFLVVGLALNISYPAVFDVGGPGTPLWVGSLLVLAVGMVIWGWSVALILTRVPRGELITTGPYAWIRHPLYTAAALLVLPWVGFLCDSWLGALVGIVLYVGSRLFAPQEEAVLSEHFGEAWVRYRDSVRIPWL